MSAALFAQESAVKVVELKHINSRSLSTAQIRQFEVHVEANGNMVVLRGAPSNVAAAEKFLARLDVPRKNLEATFHIVAADSKAEAPAAELPPDLASVIKQLRSNFIYKNYRLLDTAVIRTRADSEPTANGVLADGVTYSVQSRGVTVSSDEKGNIIRFDRLFVNLRMPDPSASSWNKKAEYKNASLAADLDVREGQKVVVGKANFSGIDGAFFVIVTARIVD
jgi:hypothetical protein